MRPILGRGEACLRPGNHGLTLGRSQGSPLQRGDTRLQSLIADSRGLPSILAAPLMQARCLHHHRAPTIENSYRCLQRRRHGNGEWAVSYFNFREERWGNSAEYLHSRADSVGEDGNIQALSARD